MYLYDEIKNKPLNKKMKYILRAIYHPLIAFSVMIIAYLIHFFPLSWIRSMTTFVSWILAKVLIPHTRVIRENLRVAYPNISKKESDKITQQVLASGLLVFAEVIWLTFNHDKIKKMSEITQEFIDKINSQGCFLITPHLGNWEVMAQMAVAYDIPLSAVAKKLRNKYLYDLILESREKFGVKIIDSDGAIRKFVKIVREGRPVGILLDQCLSPKEGGVFVNFYDLPATCSRAVASMAIKLKIPIYICSCIRTETGFKIIHCELPKKIEGYSDDVELMQDIIYCNEKLINQAPSQYSWIYKRWHFIPSDCSPEQRMKYPSYSKEESDA